MGLFGPIFFSQKENTMQKRTKRLTQGAILAAMYFTLTHLQNLLLPGSATWAIQCRLSEALCVLAFFTPAAAPGLGIGCLLFNLSYSGALPLDFLAGSLATVLSCGCMWLLRNVKIKGYPLPGMLMPALFNALFVGWELTVYIGNTGFTFAAFLLNGFYVALGELAVLLIFGSTVYYTLKRRGLDREFL